MTVVDLAARLRYKDTYYLHLNENNIQLLHSLHPLIGTERVSDDIYKLKVIGSGIHRFATLSETTCVI